MILIVDDEVSVASTVSRMLKKEGYKVETAPSGVEAYELIKQNEYKLMLLDINMPKINGAELLMLLQADGIKVPTIVMAGFDDFEAQEFKNFDNVVGFMHKPFDRPELISNIEKHALK
jgi:DNA-binding response OmpR family regulator